MNEPYSSRASPLDAFDPGIYTFPWRISNLHIWMLVTGAMIVLAFFACCFSGMAALMNEVEFSGMALLIWRGAVHVFIFLCVFTVVFSIYPAAYFLSVVEDTANGNDDVDWGDLRWYEALLKWLFLLWVFGCSAAASTAVVICLKVILSLPALLAWAMALAAAFVVFPIPLLSTMTGGSPWIVLHPRLLLRLAEKPLVTLSIYAHTVLLTFPGLALGLWMIVGLHWWLAPITGIVWSTGLLCYGRALGLAAFILGQERKRRKKRRKVRVREENED